MPSEWNPLESTTSYLPNAFQDMDCDIRNQDNFLTPFSEEFDALLPEDDILESKMCLDNNFFDSLLEEGNSCQWPDIFSQLDQIKEEDGDITIKLESLDNELDQKIVTDSILSLGGSSDASNSPDTKYILETPPVSPPINDTTMRSFESEIMNSCSTTVQNNKSPVLRINPNNVKIIQNIKGLKPVGKQTQVVLPKEILQKAIKLGTKGTTSETSNGNSVANPRTNLGCNNPVIISSSQIGGSPTISVLPHEGNSIKPGLQSTSTIPNKPHILPLIKQESDILVKNELLNLKALKRQQRMIKNRESACLSRKKKKEYITSLESKISDLEHENSKLKMENDLLKSRIKELETGFRSNGKVHTLLNSNLRKTVAIFAVLLTVSVNIGSISLLSREGLGTSELKVKGELVGNDITRRGRSLLWTQSEIKPTYSNRSISSGSSKSYSTCPLYINQTESLRLEKELRQWIAVDEKRGRYRNSTRRSTDNQNLIQQLILQNPKKIKTPNKTQRKTLSAVEIYHPPFPGSLPRREDTFYVFSFSSDHLLVPAVTHNNTLRPKMSFVIPTVPLNDSFINHGPVPMMQIDCEVLATRSIEFTEKDFRIFRPKEEVTRKGNNSAQVSMRTNTYRPYFMQRRRVRPNSEFDDGFENYMNRISQAATTFP